MLLSVCVAVYDLCLVDLGAGSVVNFELRNVDLDDVLIVVVIFCSFMFF